jgi:hypothetical protein
VFFSFQQAIAAFTDSGLTPVTPDLEADHFVILGDKLRSVCRHGELRIFGIRKRIDKAMDIA